MNENNELFERVVRLETLIDAHVSLQGHEGIVKRMNELETKHAVLETKVAIYSAMGSILGSAVITFLFKWLHI